MILNKIWAGLKTNRTCQPQKHRKTFNRYCSQLYLSTFLVSLSACKILSNAKILDYQEEIVLIITQSNQSVEKSMHQTLLFALNYNFLYASNTSI